MSHTIVHTHTHSHTLIRTHMNSEGGSRQSKQWKPPPSLWRNTPTVNQQTQRETVCVCDELSQSEWVTSVHLSVCSLFSPSHEWKHSKDWQWHEQIFSWVSILVCINFVWSFDRQSGAGTQLCCDRTPPTPKKPQKKHTHTCRMGS